MVASSGKLFHRNLSNFVKIRGEKQKKKKLTAYIVYINKKATDEIQIYIKKNNNNPA